MCPTETQSKVYKRLVDGLKAGRGLTSQLSPLMRDGARPDLIPIVFSALPSGGLRRFLTALATSYALREDDTGERMLILSWGLEAEALRSLLQTSLDDGDSDEITLELSMPVREQSGTSPSTSPSPLTTGLSGAPCDLCGEEISPGGSYVMVVTPPDDMFLYHYSCDRRGGAV